MHVTSDIRYVGVNDHQVDLFEGQYAVPKGMSYNSYVILDEKIAVMDTVDAAFGDVWLAQVRQTLDGRTPDYLVVQHMEPDHSANIVRFMQTYPAATVVSSQKAFAMMRQFFGVDFADRRIPVAENDVLSLGRHTLRFLTAPMVHWPEVIVTYDETDQVLFSADGFGKFGALDEDEDWTAEARRYYIGIVGKYGAQVQSLLKKAAGLDIAVICPLHGPVLKQPLDRYLKLYDAWSSYRPEEPGVVVAYASVYGHTREAAESLVLQLRRRGCPRVVLYDLARCDMAQAVADAFRYDKLALCATTYNADVFPCMRAFIEHLTERNYQRRTVGLVENGSWAPMAAKVMRGMLEGSKNLSFAENTVRILSALDEKSRGQIDVLAAELCSDYAPVSTAAQPQNDPAALGRIGYGLYLVTSSDGQKDNGLIVNTVTQVSENPCRLAVSVNKRNYSCQLIRDSGKMNVHCLSVDTPFPFIERFGFHSGRDTDKFDGLTPERSANGLAVLPAYANAYLSLQVDQTLDLGSHCLFLCTVAEAVTLSDAAGMTYDDYRQRVRPAPRTEGKKGYVCTVCGYVYEGDSLPDDYICPLCKHGAADFEPVG